MRNLLSIALMLAMAGAAMAFNLGNQAPAKPADNAVYNGPVDPTLQGGDTIGAAMVINVPGTFNGTTVGYTNNYDEACPYTGSTAPDVVYSVTPVSTIAVDIDLCYSSFDTKLYVYDENLNLIGCNDDFFYAAPCFTYSSKLENLTFNAGMTYYIIIDGYGTAAGAYQMDIAEFVPCVVTCPGGAQLEGEPPLSNGYADAWNGGCQSPEFGNPFQPITTSTWFCGVSGWYIGASGGAMRDTDWFTIVMPAGGVLEMQGDAEYPTYMFELGPQDCGSVGVIQNVIVGACAPNPMFIVGAPGSLVWLWVGPTTFTGPVNEYHYVIQMYIPLATENHSWTAVKSLFN